MFFRRRDVFTYVHDAVAPTLAAVPMQSDGIPINIAGRLNLGARIPPLDFFELYGPGQIEDSFRSSPRKEV